MEMNREESSPQITVSRIGPMIPPPPRMDTPGTAMGDGPECESDGTGLFSDKYNVGM